MKIQVCRVFLFFLETLRIAFGVDPFAGDFITINCFKEREVTGCNDTLLETYSKTEMAKSDVTYNKPDTRLYLFTSSNRDNPEFLHNCGGRLPSNTNYSPKCKTVIIVHGFLGAMCDFAVMREMKDQLLYRGNYNVILVDYPWGNRIDYYAAIQHSKVVAKQIVFLVQNIMNQTGVSSKKFHFIGHSLGAQVVGHAGKYFQKLVGKKIRRITGLDPALPGFNTDDPDKRLDSSDAVWVDVIHTNGGPCLPDLGDYRPIGHANFYPNGGIRQMSCYPDAFQSIFKGDILHGIFALILPTACAHLQVLQFFKTSINACARQFIGVECDSYEDFEAGKCSECGQDGSKCAVMGMDWEYYPRKKGIHSYYLKTDLLCPYCNNDGIELQGFPKQPVKSCCKPRCFNQTSVQN